MSNDKPPSTNMKALHTGIGERRAFMKGFAALTSSIGLIGMMAKAAAEPPPETTRIRLVKVGLCVAPQYVAEELLRTEGFTDVKYIEDTPKVGTSEHLSTGAADINMAFAA